MEETRKKIKGLLLGAIMFTIVAMTLYPFMYVFSVSISSANAVLMQKVWLYPKGFSLASYKYLLHSGSLWTAYGNTIFYTLCGTLISVCLTLLTAYPLSKNYFMFKKFFTVYMAVTMFFSGGLIPMFILVNNLGIYNTRWALLLPGAIGAFNVIIAKTFLLGISPALEESAKIDGANDFRVFISIVLPVSLPVIGVLILFYSVGYWNMYFNAIIYISSAKLQPLQVFLMRLLIAGNQELSAGTDISGVERTGIVEQMKYAAVIITTLPIIFAYPYAQKYFVHGLAIGALKE
ncbi:MAG: carbohydrate ABC transporter permease [Firmicutes bacterium]|nr:carbohydrate ABC transporter permease [Bacillota bacterium]